MNERINKLNKEEGRLKGWEEDGEVHWDAVSMWDVRYINLAVIILLRRIHNHICIYMFV